MARFNTTRWSLIADLRGDPGRARPALEALCRDYRPPVLAFVRRHGYAASDAEDMTQEFFARFLERRWYAEASPERGRFRALVLTALRRFILDAEASSRAQKRGGGLQHLTLDDGVADTGSESPERAFMQAWLGIVLDRAHRRLCTECQEAGRSEQLERLWDCMDGRAGSAEIEALADAMHIRRNTLAVRVSRLRSRLRQLVRLELLATVGSREDLETELGELRAVLDP